MVSSFLQKNVNSLHFFLAGLITIVLFLFQDRLDFKIVQVLVFFVLAVMAGKKIKIHYFLMFIFFITLFETLNPWGRVVFSIGSFNITEGALLKGFEKGISFTGLVFISLFSIRNDLTLPGSLGLILARVFYYFEKILSNKSKLSKKNILASIDDLLLSIYNPENIKINVMRKSSASSFAGWIFTSVLLVFNAALLIF